MKAITLWQPWASLLACGAKQYETRSWATSYRGPIAIHAAKTIVGPWGVEISDGGRETAVKALWPDVDMMADLACLADAWNELPLGSIIATAELVGCHQMVRHGGRGLSSTSPGWLETPNGIYEPTEQEILFGDWTTGRYAWEFANMRMLENPIAIAGRQGLWNWEGRLIT